ncbi:MAG: phosphate acyltransferase, partial [Thermofilaceae archaeon]
MSKPSPVMERIFERARRYRSRIVLPEATDERIAAAARRAADMKVATPVLVGERRVVEEVYRRLGLDLEGVEVVEPDPESLE